MATTEQTTITRQAPFLEDYARKLLESTYQSSLTPTDIPDIKVAGFTPDQQDAVTATRAGIGGFQPFLTGASNLLSGANTALTGVMNQPSVTGNFGASGIAQFMNPYTESVIDATQADIARQGQMAQNQLGASAVGSGAFGGSRQAIAQGEINRNVLDQQAKTGAQLRATGFESALQQARNLADAQIRERSLQGSLAGQQAGFAGQQAGLGQLQQQLGQQDVASLLGIGSLQQGQAQALLDAARQGDLQQAYEPQQRLSYFSDILRGVPSAQQTTSSVTAPTPSLLSQIGGVAATGLGLAGQLGYRPFGNTGYKQGGINSLGRTS
tara:strand:+ start:4913 stop:5887 length:975 start_codon:yes stop_codon:yes gene_type:complete